MASGPRGVRRRPAPCVAALEENLLAGRRGSPTTGSGYSRAASPWPPASSRRLDRPSSGWRRPSARRRCRATRVPSRRRSAIGEPALAEESSALVENYPWHPNLALRGPAGRLGDPLRRLPRGRRRDVPLDGCCCSSAVTRRSSVRRSRAEGADAFSWVFLVPGAERGGDDRRQRRAAARAAGRRPAHDRDRRRLRGPHRRDPRRRSTTPTSSCCAAQARSAAGQGGGAQLRLPRAARARRPRRGRSSSSSTPTAACTPGAALRRQPLRGPAGGRMQSLVRIYNRQHLLTWLQDVEFSVYGHLFQAGRDHWGTAGMGGNGQFNRLAALDDVPTRRAPGAKADRGPGPRPAPAGRGLGGAPGPARDASTSRGSRSCGRCSASAPAGRRATCRRSAAARGDAGAGRPLGARVEQMAYLLMPFWQGIIGLGLLGALFLWVSGRPFWGRPDLAARLLLPARLRRDHPRLHRRPRRAGPAGLAAGAHRPGLHALHLVHLAGPDPCDPPQALRPRRVGEDRTRADRQRAVGASAS